jgi:predicted transcriptional regulator of viral defense system
MRNTLIKNLSRTGNTFYFSEAKSVLGLDSNVTKVILSRLENRGAIERIEKGKYLIIPLNGEKGKYSLHEFIIGSILVQPYCISYWSALHYYGLTEQIPNTVFIQTSSRKKKQHTEIFGVNYQIVRIKKDKIFGTRKEWIEETQIILADREKCIIDCLDKLQFSGGIIGVARTLKDNSFDLNKLANYAVEIGNSGVIRRLGYLCEQFEIEIDLPELDTRNYLYLDPTMPHGGQKNARWRLIINVNEMDLSSLI